MAELWWETLPVGFYAIEIYGDEYDQDDQLETLGYQVFQRTRSTFKYGGIRILPGRDHNKVIANAWTIDEIASHKLLTRDAEYSQEQYGRFSGRCGRCGRTLRDPKSKLLGIGPECGKAVRRG